MWLKVLILRLASSTNSEKHIALDANNANYAIYVDVAKRASIAISIPN